MCRSNVYARASRLGDFSSPTRPPACSSHCQADPISAPPLYLGHPTEAVPATFVVDASGQVLLARWGVPTISAIKKLLWQDQAKRGSLLAERD